MEQYLRAFCNYEQDNWVVLLPLAEFAYNNSVHASTKMTPFWAVYHRHPEMQFKAPKAPANIKSEIQADAVLEGLDATHRLLWESILDAQERHTKYAGRMEITFEVGDRVWLSTKHFRTKRPSKKLDYMRAGPYMVSKIINQNAYKLDLPKTMRNHNIFQVSQLDRYTLPVIGPPPSAPLPTILDESGEAEWEVDRIVDYKRRYRKLHYLVQ